MAEATALKFSTKGDYSISSIAKGMTNHPHKGRGFAHVTHFCMHNCVKNSPRHSVKLWDSVSDTLHLLSASVDSDVTFPLITAWHAVPCNSCLKSLGSSVPQPPNRPLWTLSRVSISQDYCWDIKEDWESGGQKSPRSWSFFCETTHNICIKIQQTTVAVTRVDILNDITFKILEGSTPLDTIPTSRYTL